MVSSMKVPLFWFNLIQDIGMRIEDFGRGINRLSVHAPVTLENVLQDLEQLRLHIEVWKTKIEMGKTLEFDDGEVRAQTKTKED